MEADILDLLHRAGHPHDPAGLTDDEISRTDAVAAAALARITSSRRDADSRRPHGPRPARRRLPRFVWGSVVTAAAALIALALVVQPWGDRNDPSSTPPAAGPAATAQGPTPAMAQFSLVTYDGADLDGTSAVPELEALARAAAGRSASGSGPIQHVTLDSWYLAQDASAHAALIPTVTDRFYLADGKLRNIEYAGEPLSDVGRLTSTKPVSETPTADETYPGPDQGPAYADSLATEPAALIKQLVPDQRECPVLAQCLTNQLLDLHYTWVVPPGVTSALWQALADQRGVAFLGTTVDRLGRRAVAFAVTTDSGDRKIVVYADADTGALLGSEEVLLAQDGTNGALDLDLPAVTSFFALSASERTSSPDLP